MTGPFGRPVRPTTAAHDRRPKLTPAQREEIVRRKAAGESPTDLAREFGVTRGYIYNHL